jgi:SAM-dependent methyltransferase
MELMRKDLRDKALAGAVRGLFNGHRRLRKLELEVKVRGGVCHISGTVPLRDDLWLVRRAAAGVWGIQAVWDMLGTGNGNNPRVLDIGCGDRKQSSRAIGLDITRGASVDVVADLAKGLPFKDGSMDYVFVVHCLEHVSDLLGAMAELHRVLASDGVAHIMVPFHASTNAIADPTHVRFFNRQTFKYFCAGKPRIPLFRPVMVSSAADNVYADLSPVKTGQKAASLRELSLYFD